jgi:hypothetical protein
VRLAAFMTPSVAVGLLLALAVLPAAPTPSGLFTDEVGWPELAQQTTQVYNTVPADQRASAMIVVRYYQEAAGPTSMGRRWGSRTP